MSLEGSMPAVEGTPLVPVDSVRQFFQYMKNEQGGASIGRAMAAAFMSEDAQAADDLQRGREQMTANDHAEKMGLALVERSNPGITIFRSDPGALDTNTIDEVAITITDAKRFADVICSIPPAALQEKEVDNTICAQIREWLDRSYKQIAKDDIEIDTIKEMVPQLRRIQEHLPNTRVSRPLEQELNAVEVDSYLDLRILQESSCFDQIGTGFGPSTWQIDISPEDYREHWGKVITAIDAMIARPNTYFFLVPAIDNLIGSIAYAKEVMSKPMTEDDSDYQAYASLYKKLLQQIPTYESALTAYKARLNAAIAASEA